MSGASGTGLFLRGGVYYWRGIDAASGRRLVRSTGCRRLEGALEMAAKLRAGVGGRSGTSLP